MPLLRTIPARKTVPLRLTQTPESPTVWRTGGPETPQTPPQTSTPWYRSPTQSTHPSSQKASPSFRHASRKPASRKQRASSHTSADTLTHPNSIPASVPNNRLSLAPSTACQSDETGDGKGIPQQERQLSEHQRGPLCETEWAHSPGRQEGRAVRDSCGRGAGRGLG